MYTTCEQPSSLVSVLGGWAASTLNDHTQTTIKKKRKKEEKKAANGYTYFQCCDHMTYGHLIQLPGTETWKVLSRVQNTLCIDCLL